MPQDKTITTKEVTGAAAEDLLQLSSRVVAAYVSNNVVTTSDLPILIKSVHAALTALSGGPAETPALKPVVPVRRSIGDDYVVCLEDGKKLKMLKRYLRTRYNLSPEQYRAKWNLPADYPMVAPSYARRRSEFAKQIGLGRGAKPKTKRTRRSS